MNDQEVNYTESQLLYAATARCKCGAGLAYPESKYLHATSWQCSKVLLGEEKPSEDHFEYPFVMYEIKSEGQPSANGMTTRPSGIPKTRRESRVSMIGEGKVKLQDRIENSFNYHPPKDDDQIRKYERIRSEAKQFANFIIIQCPESRELSVALTELESAVMWANKAIACNE